MIRSTLAASLLALAASAHATEQPVVWDTVTVTGSSIAPVPIEYTFTPAPAVQGNPLDGAQFYFNLAQKQKAARSIVDVRCALRDSNPLSKVTSLNDTNDRWLAAQDVYVVIMAPETAAAIRNAVLGTVVNPSTGKTIKAFKVTYADGGTEKWMIFPTPASVVKLFDTPFPGSLEVGNGQVTPSSNCGSA